MQPRTLSAVNFWFTNPFPSKRCFAGLAILGAISSPASAQSSVVVFGLIDTNLTHISADGNPLGSRTFMDNGGINSSRLGIRGTEDMGGGLRAGFWLEAGVQANNGSGSSTSTGNGAAYSGATAGAGGLTFNRRSTVSILDDSWGELRLGRDQSPTYYNLVNIDPFNYNSIAEIGTLAADPQSATGSTISRTSNEVEYLTPDTLGGLFLLAAVALGGNPDQLQNAAGQNVGNDGNYAGVNFGYLRGPWYVALATTETHATQTLSTLRVPQLPADPSSATSGLDYGLGVGSTHVTNLGGAYDFGWIKPDLFFQSGRVNAAPQYYGTEVKSLGATIPLFANEQIRLNYVHAQGQGYYTGSHANLLGVGLVHNFSKRTALYAIVAHLTNAGAYAFSLNGYTPAPAPGRPTSGLTLGVRTSF
jgi:predicted porin